MGETPPEAGQLPGTDAAGKHLRVGAPRVDPGAPARAATAAKPAQAGKPPPRKSTARLLWAFFTLFVVYGTTFPFKFNIGWHGFLENSERINWLILGGESGDPIISDIVQNILLFIPFGLLGYFSLINKRSVLNKLGIVAAGAVLSGFVEFLQIFSPIRFPCLSDIVFNTLGTAVGLIAGVILKQSVLGFKSHPAARKCLDAQSAYPALVFVLLAAAGCWAPFDFSLDVHTVGGHLKALIREPFRLSRPDDDIAGFIRFLLAGLFVCRLAHEMRWRRPALSGAVLVAILGVCLEMSQVIIQSRSPGLQDAMVAALGAACGGVAFFFPGFHRRPLVWTAAGGLMVLVSACARSLFPYDFGVRHTDFNWVPFMSHYQTSTFAALGDFVEESMLYFPVGFLLAYFFPRMRPALLAAVIAGGMCGMVELAQGFVPDRYSDVTDVLGAALGAFAGGLTLTRGWPAFRDYMRRDDDDQV